MPFISIYSPETRFWAVANQRPKKKNVKRYNPNSLPVGVVGYLNIIFVSEIFHFDQTSVLQLSFYPVDFDVLQIG